MTTAAPLPPGRIRRHLGSSPCPVCGGHAGLAQGRRIRCAGFTLDRVAYCTREEFAGRLPLEIGTAPPAFKHQLLGSCGCGVEHGRSAVGVPVPVMAPERTSLPLETRDAIYQATLTLLPLRDAALADLTRRGLPADVVQEIGYRSIPHRGNEHRQLLATLIAQFGEETLRACPGFTDKNDRLTFWTAFPGRDGYAVPYRDDRGRITGLQLRLLDGRYQTARRTRIEDVYHVVGCVPGGDLFVTEGATKANVAHHLGGVGVFAVAGQSLQPAHIEAIQGPRTGTTSAGSPAGRRRSRVARCVRPVRIGSSSTRSGRSSAPPSSSSTPRSCAAPTP